MRQSIAFFIAFSYKSIRLGKTYQSLKAKD